MGTPMLADEKKGTIIDHLGDLSKPFGIRISYQEGVGVVSLP
jgi:hypothetical protein